MEHVKPPAKIVAVRLPDGDLLTIANLPPAGMKRWVARRKAEVVAAVRGGLISLDEACRRYSLSQEEFSAWQNGLARYGVPGLRVTHMKHYRKPRTPNPNPERDGLS